MFKPGTPALRSANARDAESPGRNRVTPALRSANARDAESPDLNHSAQAGPTVVARADRRSRVLSAFPVTQRHPVDRHDLGTDGGSCLVGLVSLRHPWAAGQGFCRDGAGGAVVLVNGAS